ncbi:MAG TPA: SPOR domain-containing protein [Bacteroidia bacterium]|nr:SPOR domain-containing protein [Bacteroidia bacterium]
MNIDSSINELLFNHDCVIVPGLGGFVASPRPALHNKIHHIFIPPARVIAFNVFLKQNDGLLASYISGHEKISFSEAMNFLEKYVERCFMEMAAGRRFYIAEVGQLYYDAEKNIQFESDDIELHSSYSFGLTTIRVIPVSDKVGQENVLFSPLRQSVSPKEKRKAQRKYSGRKMMNALLVTGIALWASFNLYIITPHNFNLGNLNPFEKTLPPTYTPRGKDKTTVEIISPALPAIQPSSNEAITAVVEEINKPENIVVKKEEENIPVTSAEENIIEAGRNYFVVAGVFSIPSNAENFLSKLKADGYESSGSIERENKPTMIFIAKHAQKEDAVSSVYKLKEKGIDAWVYAVKN